MRPASALAFYTAADANYFLGLAGLVNSLRLLGHPEPVIVVDLGLAGWQRTLLEDHVMLVPAPPGLHPFSCVWEGPRLRPAETMVLIDADMVVTRPLEPIVSPGQERAVVVAFEDRLRERYFPEWSAALDLPEIVQRRAYVNAGLLVFSGSRGADVLTTIRSGQSRLAGQAPHGGSRRVDPFYWRDQDVLNAVLMASLGREELVVLDHRLAPFAIAAPDLSVVDLEALRCEYPDGVSPFVVHHTHKKPWLAATPQNAYTAPGAAPARRRRRHPPACRRGPAALPQRPHRRARASAGQRGRAALAA